MQANSCEHMNVSSVIWGYLFSLVCGGLTTWLVMDVLIWGKLHRINNKRFFEHREITIILGFLERLFYTSAVILLKPEWIPFWLTLKTATTWGRWGDKRPEFNSFLIGNLLTIGFGVAGAWIAMRRIGL